MRVARQCIERLLLVLACALGTLLTTQSHAHSP